MTGVIRYHGDNGARTGLLVAEGTKYLSLLLMDNPLRITKVPLSEAKHITHLTGYNTGRAKRIFRDAAKRFHGGLRGCTKSVREVIR